MNEHRWSGWPGAYCLDCGAEDQNEVCLACHDVLLYCIEGHFMCTEHPHKCCEQHVNSSCTAKDSSDKLV